LTFKEGSKITDIVPSETCHDDFYWIGGTIGVYLLPGDHPITVEYSGTTGFSPGVSNPLVISILKIPTHINYDKSSIRVVYGQPAFISGEFYNNVYLNPIPIPRCTGTVTFTENGGVVSAVPINPDCTFSATFSALPVGTHTIIAAYSGDNNFESYTANYGPNITVTKAASVIRLDSLMNAALAGQVVTFTAAVQAQAPGAGIPGGTVTFKEGTTVLGTASLDSAGAATFSQTFALGNHPITAFYSADSNFNASQSADLNQQVVELCSGQVVSLTEDNGNADTCGTLSYALKTANELSAQATPFVIGFSTPTLTLTQPLPLLSNPAGVAIVLNGGCQLQNGRGMPGVKLAKGAGAGNTALTLGNNVTVKGFAVIGFADWAIEAQGSNNTLACNWLGTADGLSPAANGGGIHLSGSNNLVGVAGQPESGNLVGGNTGKGLQVESGSAGNQAYFNWFGLKANGQGGLANQSANLNILPGGAIQFGPGNRIQV
jgi:hypothetical protein